MATLWTRPAESLGWILFPEDWRDFVSVEAVEDPTGFLGLDQTVVQVTRAGKRFLDGRLGYLMEDHSLDRHLGFEDLDQVPSDGLTFAVLVGSQVQLVNTLEKVFELLDVCFAVLGNYI